MEDIFEIYKVDTDNNLFKFDGNIRKISYDYFLFEKYDDDELNFSLAFEYNRLIFFTIFSDIIGDDCIKFRKCRNPKPNKNDSILKHGVLICKKCNALWNRDENSSRNIYKIAFNAINKKDRPTYLCRSKKEEDDKELTK
ncbi:MAG: hypothetical protein HOG13_08060, partial [Candidatus Marinimicrobia bacterium]|nr:hypothetical protein [Candidatus Neomarinimicrobiota bacterium]